MIEFDAEKHEYKDSGVIKPCVSDILGDLGFNSALDRIPQKILANKARIGKAVHAYISGTGKMTAEIMPYIIQYQKWFKAFKPKIVKQETPICNEFYCGTPDVELKDTIVDIKTSNEISRACYLQIAAYCMLTGKRKGIILHLRKNGFNPIIVCVPIITEIWKQCLGVYKYKRS
jgi:hypothetical protein